MSSTLLTTLPSLSQSVWVFGKPLFILKPLKKYIVLFYFIEFKVPLNYLSTFSIPAHPFLHKANPYLRTFASIWNISIILRKRKKKNTSFVSFFHCLMTETRPNICLIGNKVAHRQSLKSFIHAFKKNPWFSFTPWPRKLTFWLITHKYEKFLMWIIGYKNVKLDSTCWLHRMLYISWPLPSCLGLVW